MNVSYMLELMGTLGVGEGSNVVPKDVYLQYLNLANLKLYSKTAPFNDDVLIETDTTVIIGNNYFNLTQTPQLISGILVNGQENPLIHRSAQAYKLFTFENQNASDIPKIYKRVNDRIYFYPFVNGNTYDITTIWAPPPAVLTEDTVEDDIPYPVCYQDTLVYEALCILFAGEGGYRSSKNQERAEFEAKSRTSSLIAYLQGSNIHNMHTFRNA